MLSAAPHPLDFDGKLQARILRCSPTLADLDDFSKIL